MRALWDYYKVDGVINTQYELKRKVTPTGSEREGPGEASFSMQTSKESISWEIRMTQYIAMSDMLSFQK